MARNITARFDDDLVAEIDAVSDVLGLSVSEFLRQAARNELKRARDREDFPVLVEEERQRQAEKFALVEA